MAYTLGQLVTDLQNKLEDSSFSSTLLKQFINDTQREIANKHSWSWLESSYSGALTVDQHEYDMPAGVDLIQTFRFTNPSGYEKDISRGYVDFRTFDAQYPDPQGDNSGQPEYWTVRDQNFLVYPKPDQAYTLDIRYSKIVTTLSADADVPELPERHQELLILGALYRAHKFNDDYDIAEYEEGKFREMLEEAVQRDGRRQAAVPSRMRLGWRV